MRFVITVAGLALAASIIVPKYATQLHGAAPASSTAPRLMAAQPAAAPAVSDSRSVVIPPSGNGHFQVEGRIDGRRLEFHGRYRRFGDCAHRARRRHARHPSGGAAITGRLVKTANGTVRAAPVELDMVEIDDLVVRDVAAMVLPDGALNDNLLGLSFLQRLRRFEYADGKLVLEQ